ncbi:MAG: hypothetical protein BroJett030_20300 [Alphaproteobacteria bacterium]|nr:MAG: hypothetical protein BroJett030_20300 [Alphaproteobacteria bacterium]
MNGIGLTLRSGSLLLASLVAVLTLTGFFLATLAWSACTVWALAVDAATSPTDKAAASMMQRKVGIERFMAVSALMII